mmetsp:Transcript_67536/g.206833  ORF Transcript_67536/g.206833 Transcript_67536/m.206833 type:complete len:220 (-) Transcript_67536:110-769(-)
MLLKMENSPIADDPAGRSAAGAPAWRGSPDACVTRHSKRAAGSAVPRRSIRCSNTPGRTSTRTFLWPGWMCTAHGSSLARPAKPADAASLALGTCRGGCHSDAALGTCKRHSGGKFSNTECSWRREAKRHRVPMASLRSEKSSHAAGSWPKMAFPEGNNGTEDTSSGTNSRGLSRTTGADISILSSVVFSARARSDTSWGEARVSLKALSLPPSDVASP